MLVKAFAIVCEASRRVLNMKPYDVQIIAAIALHQGKIVEMKTGEGKTLAGVMPAYLNALTGKGVHILTFNDYLARRDAQWMGPVYEFLGLSVGYVNEGMSITERQKAYSCDITYVTAKEVGFDYLRDFLCYEKDRLVLRKFNYAIVDEADSVFIDEARIPLVIAGDVAEEEEELFRLSKIVKELKLGEDYELDEYEKNIALTDAGLIRVEKILGCDNLYVPENLGLLTRINSALHAEVLIERDKDYIVRNGRIEIIDEFTGRIADKRHWPDNLQSAVETKEGLKSQSKGKIMGSIPLQYFLSLYQKISGMTRTACIAAEEFREFYCLDVVVVPTNNPCIRKDYPDVIFANKEAKHKVLISEIERIHETGQPILIGTNSVQESEMLADELNIIGIKCKVLNAKNDEMEAKIIARAGEVGAVTVSTNMAGRGVDIKLGGEREQERDKVVALGGLYVIGTNKFESKRIDNQLKGRAGRQGDPGESRFFISIEDEIFKKYSFKKMLPKLNMPQKQDERIDDPIFRREMESAQRVLEGYNSDIRRQLWKYSFIMEQQRRIIHSRRQNILMDKEPLQLLSTKAEERYFFLQNQLDDKVLRDIEKQLTLYYINRSWAEYLDYMSYVRESIHLVAIGKKNPLDEFHKIAIEVFDNMMDRIECEIINKFNTIEIKENSIDVDKEGLKGPSSTWTYLINDNPNQFSSMNLLIKGTSSAIKGTLFSLKSIYNRILKKSM
nr:accessory Sec system translocase SecA2 [Abyssisolibacter fermentans]